MKEVKIKNRSDRLMNKLADRLTNKSTMIIIMFISFTSFTLFVFFVPTVVLAKKAIGWHWYNEIYPKNERNQKQVMKDMKKGSAIFQMSMLRRAVREAKAKAILYPTKSNIRVYLILQNFVMSKAALFTQVWKKTLLDYPELDYSILHPTQNSAQHILYAERSRKEDEVINSFSKKYGLLFFYRGNSSLDQALAPTIESFSKKHNISLLPVSVDGKNLPVFDTNHVDNGQAEKLGIKHFPALVLVDPKDQKILPLNYGYISSSELRRRFLQVATNFQEGV